MLHKSAPEHCIVTAQGMPLGFEGMKELGHRSCCGHPEWDLMPG